MQKYYCYVQKNRLFWASCRNITGQDPGAPGFSCRAIFGVGQEILVFRRNIHLCFLVGSSLAAIEVWKTVSCRWLLRAILSPPVPQHIALSPRRSLSLMQAGQGPSRSKTVRQSLYLYSRGGRWKCKGKVLKFDSKMKRVGIKGGVFLSMRGWGGGFGRDCVSPWLMTQ